MRITKDAVESLIEVLETLIADAQAALDNGEIWLESEDADKRREARADLVDTLSDLPRSIAAVEVLLR